MFRPSKVSLIPKATIGLLTAFFLLNLSWKMIRAGSYAPEIGGFERNVIWGIQQMVAGNPLYSNPDAAPFTMIQYMPLYYHIVCWLSRIGGIQPDDAHSVFLLARSLNLLLSLLTSGLLFTLLRSRLKVSLILASGTSLLTFLLMPAFTLAARPDTLKVFFIILHIFILLYFQHWRLRYLMPASLICALFCFLSKQDALTSFGLMPLAFLIGKEWRNLLIYGIFGLAVTGLTILFLQGRSEGWFLANALGALQNGISLSWFKSGFFHFFGLYAVFFAPAIVLSLEFAQEKNRNFRILSAAFLLAFFPQLAASLKFGSASNYFMEATLISCLLLAYGFQTYSGRLFFRFQESLQLLGFVSMLLWFSVPSLEWASGVFLHQEARLKIEYQEEKKVAKQFRDLFPEQKFMVLTDRQWEDYQTNLLWNQVINPTRDVSEQVYNGKKGNALQALNLHLRNSHNILLITRNGQIPSFPGMDFSGFHRITKAGSYDLWGRQEN
jgi:hypothetical protein